METLRKARSAALRVISRLGAFTSMSIKAEAEKTRFAASGVIHSAYCSGRTLLGSGVGIYRPASGAGAVAGRSVPAVAQAAREKVRAARETTVLGRMDHSGRGRRSPAREAKCLSNQ